MGRVFNLFGLLANKLPVDTGSSTECPLINTLVFLFSVWGGPGPQNSREGTHLPWNKKRTTRPAPRWKALNEKTMTVVSASAQVVV